MLYLQIVIFGLQIMFWFWFFKFGAISSTKLLKIIEIQLWIYCV